MTVDIGELTTKIDKLQSDVQGLKQAGSDAVANLRAANDELKAELATVRSAAGAGTIIDLQPLADKVDAIDQVVTAAEASFNAPPAAAPPVADPAPPADAAPATESGTQS